MPIYTFNGVTNENTDYSFVLDNNGVPFQAELADLIFDFLALNAMEITASKRYEVIENITPVI